MVCAKLVWFYFIKACVQLDGLNDILSYRCFLLEVTSVTLRNADKENKRSKSERSFTFFYFLN